MFRVNSKMYDINMMDGNAFLTWLQKLGRVSEEILLGRLDERTVTLDHFNFSEPPGPSSVSPSRAALSPTSSSGGLSLPRIKSIRETSSVVMSPSAEVVASERSVSRGVGTDEALSPSFHSRAFSPPRTTGSLFSSSLSSSPLLLLPTDEDDPYRPYMTNHYDLTHGAKHRERQNRPAMPSRGALSPMMTDMTLSSSSLLPLPLQQQDHLTGNESIVSAVTDSSMFSPIHPSHLSSDSVSSSTQPMVASLLGTNPWSEIDQERKRGRRGANKRVQSPTQKSIAPH
jgi:hypothetical protein